MSDEAWRPLGFDDEAASLDGPHEGVPAWLAPSLWEWIDLRMTEWTGRVGYRRQYFRSDLARTIERVCRINIPYTGTAPDAGLAALRKALDDEKRLVVADFLLANEADAHQQHELNTMLLEAGSVWSVGPRRGAPGLVRRMSPSLTAAAESVMLEGHAGDRLAEAWSAAFGLNPDPSRAYSLAVKAIEDAAIPVVAPRDSTTTLGKVIGQLKNDPRWTLPFQRDDTSVPSGQALTGILKAIWAGQVDRHGGVADQDSSSANAVTQEAAETAVMLAVAVIPLFTTGKVTRGA